MQCSALADVLPCWWDRSTDESMQVCLNTWERSAETANWTCVPYMVVLFTEMIYSVRSEAWCFYLCAFFSTVVNSIPEHLMATIKGQCMWGPPGFGVPPDDVVPPLIMALLTEIHYLFIQSPLDIKGECSQTTGFTTVKSYWCGFMSYSWKEVTVSSLSQDDSVGLRPGVAGVVFDFVCCSIPRSHRLSFSSLPLSLRHFSPSQTQSVRHRGMHTLFVCSLLLLNSLLSQ